MTTVLVDSNVILDVLTNDVRWSAVSGSTLADLANRARLVINPIVYAEISVRYSRKEEVEEALPDLLHRESIPYAAAFLAAKAFREYRRRGGVKTSPLPDFFVGAHAAILCPAAQARHPRGLTGPGVTDKLATWRPPCPPCG